MLKTTFNCIAGGALFLGLSVAGSIGCASDDVPTEITEAEAKQKAVAVYPGTAGAVERIETPDEHRWAVTVSGASGGEAVVELERADGRIDEIKSERGPWEYDFPAPRADIATYGKARSASIAAKAGQIEAWEVNLLKNVWEFYVRAPDGQLWEIKLNAQNGALTSTKEKTQRD